MPLPLPPPMTPDEQLARDALARIRQGYDKLVRSAAAVVGDPEATPSRGYHAYGRVLHFLELVRSDARDDKGRVSAWDKVWLNGIRNGISVTPRRLYELDRVSGHVLAVLQFLREDYKHRFDQAKSEREEERHGHLGVHECKRLLSRAVQETLETYPWQVVVKMINTLDDNDDNDNKQHATRHHLSPGHPPLPVLGRMGFRQRLIYNRPL